MISPAITVRKKRLTPEQAELAAQNYDLVGIFLRSHRLSEDYHGVSCEGLCKAAMQYRPQHNTPFRAWAKVCMLSSVRNEMTNKNRYLFHTQEPPEYFEPSYEQDLSAVEGMDTMRVLRAALSAKEYHVLLELLNEKRPSEIADSMGISRMQVSRIRRCIREKAAALLEGR